MNRHEGHCPECFAVLADSPCARCAVSGLESFGCVPGECRNRTSKYVYQEGRWVHNPRRVG